MDKLEAELKSICDTCCKRAFENAPPNITPEDLSKLVIKYLIEEQRKYERMLESDNIHIDKKQKS